jgi:hypothetical protein
MKMGVFSCGDVGVRTIYYIRQYLLTESKYRAILSVARNSEIPTIRRRKLVMKMYLYPGYVSLGSAEEYSPKLFELLRSKGVSLEAPDWNGSIESLPTDERVIVRASTILQYRWKTLAEACQRLGHLVFYDDLLVLPNGDHSREQLLPAAEQFLSETMAAH